MKGVKCPRPTKSTGSASALLLLGSKEGGNPFRQPHFCTHTEPGIPVRCAVLPCVQEVQYPVWCRGGRSGPSYKGEVAPLRD